MVTQLKLIEESIELGFIDLKEMIDNHINHNKELYLDSRGELINGFKFSDFEKTPSVYNISGKNMFLGIVRDMKKMNISGFSYIKKGTDCHSYPDKDELKYRRKTCKGYYPMMKKSCKMIFHKDLFTPDEFILEIYDCINKTRILTSREDLSLTYCFPRMYNSDVGSYGKSEIYSFELKLLVLDMKNEVIF